jgi:hypothetical protein
MQTFAGDAQYSIEGKVIGSDGIGWQRVQERFNRVKDALAKETHADYQAYRKSPTELWVYDSRPELGIGMHQVTDGSLKLAEKLGIRFVRYTMYWNTIETTVKPKVYDKKQLEMWDKTVKMAKKHGVELLVVVHAAPPGVNWDNRYDSYKRFAGFISDMAARYPSVRYWELWNEMNVAFTDLFGAGKEGEQGYKGGKDYAAMLKLAYPAIKRSNQKAFVVMGGFAWDWREFLRGIYEAGGKDYFDVMNIHSYGMPVDWGFLTHGYIARHMMRKYGDASKPLWITEFGVDAGNMVNAWGFAHDRGESDGDYFDSMHLNEWKKCIDEAREGRLYQKYFPYQFSAGNELKVKGIETEDYAKKYLPAGMTIDDYGFGLMRRDGKTPKPTYDWLLKEQVNSPIREKPTRVYDVSIPYDGYVPVGYEYDVSAGVLVIKSVQVGSAVPVRIVMREE